MPARRGGPRMRRNNIGRVSLPLRMEYIWSPPGLIYRIQTLAGFTFQAMPAPTGLPPARLRTIGSRFAPLLTAAILLPPLQPDPYSPPRILVKRGFRAPFHL